MVLEVLLKIPCAGDGRGAGDPSDSQSTIVRREDGSFSKLWSTKVSKCWCPGTRACHVTMSLVHSTQAVYLLRAPERVGDALTKAACPLSASSPLSSSERSALMEHQGFHGGSRSLVGIRGKIHSLACQRCVSSISLYPQACLPCKVAERRVYGLPAQGSRSPSPPAKEEPGASTERHAATHVPLLL